MGGPEQFMNIHRVRLAERWAKLFECVLHVFIACHCKDSVKDQSPIAGVFSLLSVLLKQGNGFLFVCFLWECNNDHLRTTILFVEILSNCICAPQ